MAEPHAEGTAVNGMPRALGQKVERLGAEKLGGQEAGQERLH
jgi:hypothetical protein